MVMTAEYRTVTDVDNDLMKHLWELYCDTFTPLAIEAIQRHVMFWDEFVSLIGDPNVTKYLAEDEHGLAALALLTTDLTAVPLVSPDYFQHHWPELYDDRRIFYVPFVCVRQQPKAPTSTFAQLITDMSRPVAESRGIAVMDYCTANVERGLPKVSRAIISRAHGRDVPVTMADQQSFWTYDLTGN